MRSGWGGGSPAECSTSTTPSGCASTPRPCNGPHRPIPPAYPRQRAPLARAEALLRLWRVADLRAEVFAAFGLLNEARPFPGCEGVFCDEATRGDVFFITLKKSERLFSPSGQRYIHHRQRGSRVMLFVREENKRGGVTMPFLCLGFANYVSHEGERPMAIRWRLQQPIPAAFYPELAVAV
jgi:hypothetical protein